MNLAYAAPTNLGETLKLLRELGPDAVILAGGMSIAPRIRRGTISAKCIVNIKRTGLSTAAEQDSKSGALTIGALVRHREVEKSRLVANHWPCLVRLEQNLAAVQIRNHGTVIGNLCAAEPFTDLPCLLAALAARLTIVWDAGVREASAQDWIIGPSTTQIAPHEFVTQLQIPPPTIGSGAGYARLAPRQGLARPLVCAAARVELAEERVLDARIFIGALGPRPQRLNHAEASIRGERADARLASRFGEALGEDIEEVLDPRCGLPYKRRVIGVLVARAVNEAVEHAARRSRA